MKKETKKVKPPKGGGVTTQGGPKVPIPDDNGNCPAGWYNSDGKCVLNT